VSKCNFSKYYNEAGMGDGGKKMRGGRMEMEWNDKTTWQIVMKFGVNHYFIYYRKTINTHFENFVSDKRCS